ncbi:MULTISPECIES: hypothetical protein [Pseudomonas]|uniref:hypothetical protein n=1 Tax=Pseudomonas TaxID=286 RepID=UPI0009B907C7|nr:MULTISPECIES: hypothetical protein [Pseudomonas]
MTRTTARQCWSWGLLSLLAIGLSLTAACAGKSASARYTASNIGSNCYAKALPTVGEGGLAWGDTLSMARKKSLNGVVRRNPRNFRQPSSSPATSASRSMNLPSVWKV